MLKQFLSKLPWKSSKSDSNDLNLADPSHSSSSQDTSARISRRSNQSNGGNSSGRHNTAKHTSSSVVFLASIVSGIEPLVPFKDVPNAEKMYLFVSKLSLCCVPFDFTNPVKNTVEKDVKRKTLLELVDFVDSGSMKFSEHAIFAMCKMSTINLFRVFPPNYRSNVKLSAGGKNDDVELTFDPAWPHLHIVYDLLRKFITSSCLDAEVAKKYFDHSFISKLLDKQEDPRERDYLKTILHRVYGKFMVHRPYIRKSFNNIFYWFVFEMEKHNGIAELLEIFGSIFSLYH